MNTSVTPPADEDALTSSQLFYVAIGHITEVLFGVSVICALITILTFSIFRRIRTYPIKLIIYLCVTIVVGQTAFIIDYYISANGSACVIVGAVVHYFLLANFFWCFCIAFNFYQMIVKRNPGTRHLEKYYHLIGWGIPAVGSLIVSGNLQYGLVPFTSFCYIKNTFYVLGTLFVPGLLVIATNVVLFIFVASEIHGTLSNAPESEKREKTKEFRVLMSIFVTIGLSWIFGFLNSMFSWVDILYQFLLVLTTIFTPLQGLFIFIAYCLNKKVANNWMILFGKVFPCCKVDIQTSKTGATGRTQSTRGGGYSSSTQNSYSSSRSVN